MTDASPQYTVEYGYNNTMWEYRADSLLEEFFKMRESDYDFWSIRSGDNVLISRERCDGTIMVKRDHFAVYYNRLYGSAIIASDGGIAIPYCGSSRRLCIRAANRKRRWFVKPSVVLYSADLVAEMTQSEEIVMETLQNLEVITGMLGVMANHIDNMMCHDDHYNKDAFSASEVIANAWKRNRERRLGDVELETEEHQRLAIILKMEFHFDFKLELVSGHEYNAVGKMYVSGEDFLKLEMSR